MDAATHTKVVNETAAKIRARFPHQAPPTRSDAPEYDSVGRAVHYGTPTVPAGEAITQIIDSEFNRAYRGELRPHPDDPTTLLGGDYLHMTDDAIRARFDTYRIDFEQQLAEHAAAYEAWKVEWQAGRATLAEKPINGRAGRFRSGDEQPIMLDHVDPYGRVIRCKTVSAARAEAERHDCTIKAGPGS